MVERPRTTRCPTCGTTIEHDDPDGIPLPRPAYAPFCSDRCKMADLGRWLTEAHSIPTGEFEGDDDG